MYKTFLLDTITGKEYDLEALARENSGEITIGRIGFGNTIQVGTNPRGKLERKVSRHHAVIKKFAGFKIKDQFSTNGTRINNQPIIFGYTPVLKNGNKLYLGPYGPLVFREEIVNS